MNELYLSFIVCHIVLDKAYFFDCTVAMIRLRIGVSVGFSLYKVSLSFVKA